MVKYMFLGIIVAVSFLSACQDSSDTSGKQKAKKTEQKLMIGVAANVQYAMKELVRTFEQQHHISIGINISSSGKLTAQIQQGAPYDLFLSANMKYPQTLYDKGYAIEAPRIYGYGAIVLWTMKEFEQSTEEAILKESNFEKLAIANPRNAPYGEQAIRMFEHYQLIDQIEPKLVYGESIAQTNQYIASKACDLGVTAKSAVLSPDLNGMGNWLEISSDAYSPIQQGVVITKYGFEKHPKMSKAFFDFLFSKEAQEIFKKYGYKI